MKLKVDKGLLPVKAHYFFFFAALGPLLPQMNVFGRQLGVSASTMGLVTAVLPLLWAAAKPLFGYLVDYFTNQRKLIFMLLIMLMTSSYCGLWFLPVPKDNLSHLPLEEHIYRLNDTVYLEKITNKTTIDEYLLEKYNCHWNCRNGSHFEIYISNATFVNTIYVEDEVTNDSCSLFHMDLDDFGEGQIKCVPKDGCDLLCVAQELFEYSNITKPKNRLRRELASNVDTNNINITDKSKLFNEESNTRIASVHAGTDVNESGSVVYMTAAFWWFVVLMCVGTVAFNVANCIGDAVCFDVLGPDRNSLYGSQRAWGTVGYGVTALLGGWLLDVRSPTEYKDFTPAFLLAMAFTVIDLFSASRLKLPRLSSPEDSGAALLQVLKMPRVLIFILFAVLAGTFDSFIIYYMFWFLEELAEQTGYMHQIKTIEGVVVAAESFIGELLFFFLSGKILDRFGVSRTMSFCFLCYGVRLALISAITNPWHLLAIEAVMQGPTYALMYSSIVTYAAAVAPAGYSATVQGVVAGMDDGLGFAIGSLLGGQIYSWLGARDAFRLMALVALVTCVCHVVLSRLVTNTSDGEVKQKMELTEPEGERMLQINHELTNTVYRDTVVPLTKETTVKNDR